MQRFGYRDEKTQKLPDDKIHQQCYFVFINLRINYSVVRLALVNLISSKENSSFVEDGSKEGGWAKCVLINIKSCVFCFGWTELKMSSEYFKRRRMPWTITNVSKNIYGQDIMLICSKWKAQKTYMGSEVRYTNIGTLRQTRLQPWMPNFL